MSDIPPNWVSSTLGGIAETISYGFTTGSSHTATGPKLLRITDIQDGDVVWPNVPHCIDTPDDSFMLRDGDIVIARTGATTGKSYLIQGLKEPIVFASYLIRARLMKQIDPRYVWAFMQSNDYWSQIQVVSKGTAQPGANAQILSELSLPIAPPSEQRRVVEKIDSLSSKSKRAREHLDHLPRLVEKYKQAVLAAAFRGDLTKEWRAKNSVPPETHVLSDLTSELSGLEFSTSWTSAPISDLAENHDGKRRPIRAADRSLRHGKYRYYGASGVIDSIDDYLFDGDYLLIGEDGANLISRSTPIAFLASGQFWVNNHAHILRAKPLTSNAYLGWFINQINLAPYVTGTAQPKLTQANLNKIRAPLPPIDEQLEIVRRIEHLFAWIDRLSSEAGSARKLIDRLDQQVLAKAFAGELVPQDPADEPASELLERIKAEQKVIAKSTRRSKRSE